MPSRFKRFSKVENIKIGKVSFFLEKIVQSSLFNAFITFCLITNTIVLSLDRYPISPQESQIYDLLNIIFTGIFALEMILKLFGLGLKNYLSDQLNIFDSLIVLTSLCDTILSQSGSDFNSGGYLAVINALRSLRLFRIFKLARSWVNLKNLLLTIIKTVQSMWHFMILLFLFMVISSLLGMELFAFKARFDLKGNYTENGKLGTSPRNNFDTFY